MKNYNHLKIEKKWQGEWQKKKIYQTAKDLKKDKFYGLMEFPYPSGDGLHVGHVRGYTAMDIISRQKRMNGYNTLFPIGWDAFGLPTENYAIKTGQQPKLITKKNTDNFKKQFNLLGMSFDWSREINTTDPAYYKWTQWIFLQFFKKGLAYKKKVEINWCLNCKIGLANEEVVNNLCERCGGEVVKKEKEQWMLGITKYADRLDQDLDLVDYPERVKSSQRNWIGRSEGSEIEFKLHLPPTPSEGRGEGISKEGGFGYQTTDAKTWKILQDRVIEMRKNPTPAEEMLWQSLRKNLTGYHFRRQQIINKFIVDFVCISKKLVIEVDGDIHDLQKEKDAERTKILKLLGFKVIRFKNEEVIKDINSVIKKIEEELKVLPFGEDLGGVKVFTTRADTLFGATYVVLAPEHPFLSKSLFDNIENKEDVEDYIKKVKSKSDLERTENKEKTGVEMKGVKVINPSNNEEISIWVADYVLPHYGTGAVMAVPAHDERDFEFAQKYNLPIKRVIENNISEEAFVDDGVLCNSGKFDGMNSEEARKEITKEVGGKIVTKYKLRDWIFSRQRYWGEPIPLVFCKKCNWVPIAEKDLPVKLPEVKNYKPTDNGESPLANISKWVNVKCPKCKGLAKRETDTMPNWAGSSWYYLRYLDPKNKKVFADKKKLKYWLGYHLPPNLIPKEGENKIKFLPFREGLGGVDHYNGGMEHTTLHLLYSRFWHKFLYDLKLVPTTEPYQKRTSHGMILAEGGVKMSKSKGNVINPDDIIKIYGSDTLRIYEMFIGPFEDTAVWNTESIIGSRRFVEKVWRIGESVLNSPNTIASPSAFVQVLGSPSLSARPDHSQKHIDSAIQKLLHKTIKKVTEDIQNMRFNTAISAMMILATEIEKIQGKALDIAKGSNFSVDDFKKFLQILAPFAPHVTEELWFMLDNKKSIHLSPWPSFDENLIKDDEIKIVIQVNGKVRAEMLIGVDLLEEEIKNLALKNENVLKFISGQEIKKIIYVKNRLVSIVV